jgi:hypothetical protein
MPATLSLLPEGALLLRAGPEHFSIEDKDPYTFTAVVVIKDGVAEIQGASGVMHSMADVREVLEQIKMETGAIRIRWERSTGKKVSI